MSLIAIIEVIYETFRSFFRDDGTNLAASISFYIILSLIPLILLSASIFGFFLDSVSSLMDQTIERIRLILPFMDEGIIKALKHIIADREALGGGGIIILLWTVNQIFSSIESVLNQIFQVAKIRGFLISRLVSLGLTLALGLSLVTSVGLGILTNLIKNTQINFIPVQPGTIISYPVFTYGIPLVLLTLSFAILIVILPHGRVYFRHALLGGVIFASLFEMSKHLFTYYILKISKVSLIYGSFGSLVILVFWIFYLAVLFIYSAEFVSVIQRRGEEKRMRRSIFELEETVPLV